jgi:branched-chain amino acid transport system permease protein
VWGYTGILSLGHGLFFALGGYAHGMYLMRAGKASADIVPDFMTFLSWKTYPWFWSFTEHFWYAMFLMLEDITKLIWGANPYYVSEPYALFGNIDIGSQSYVGYDLLLVALAVLVGGLVWWGLNRTRFGKIVTAVIHSPEIASSMGIKVSRVYMVAFAIGIFLAALGGAFTAPMISVQPGVSVGVIIISFAVVIIGGLGSIEGAAIGALIVGLARAMAVHLMPVAELFSIYLVMAIVLMFRPEGLFQRVQARKI